MSISTLKTSSSYIAFGGVALNDFRCPQCNALEGRLAASCGCRESHGRDKLCLIEGVVVNCFQ